MEFDSVIKKRKSVRKFRGKKVSWKKVLDAIDAASQGAFAGNINNLKFIIVEHPERIEEIAKHSGQMWIASAPIVVLVTSDNLRIEKMYGARGEIYSRQHSGSAIETFILKLTDLGLDACWVGAYSDELLKEFFKIPQHIQIEGVVPIGYADQQESDEGPRKKELENCIFWEKWDAKRRPTVFEEGEDRPKI